MKQSSLVILVTFAFVGGLFAQEEVSKSERYGGYILAEDDASRTLSAHLNLAMIRVAVASFERDEGQRVWEPLVLRFDAGNLRKRDLSRAQKHFDQMVRRIGMGQMDEAYEQIFRAERFIKRTFPYSMDFGLLSEILYYRARVDAALGGSDKGVGSYCKYLFLMSNLSRTPIPISQKVEELPSCNTDDATGELVVHSRNDVGIVYLDGAPAGVVSPDVPFSSPFLAQGLHFVEVRAPGKARWGKVVDIEPGKSVAAKVKLKRSRTGVNEQELQPLMELLFFGQEKSDDSYIQDILFQYTQRVGLKGFILGKVIKTSSVQYQLGLLKFEDGAFTRNTETIDAQTFEYDGLMLGALRKVGLDVSALGGEAPKQRPEFLFFKVK